MHKFYMKTAPINILKMFNVIDVAAPRRERKFFSVPYNRLCNTDKSLIFIGPKLYNKTVNMVNKEIKYITTSLQDKFLNSFKSTVTKHLLDTQALEPNDQEWNKINFALYGK